MENAIGTVGAREALCIEVPLTLTVLGAGASACGFLEEVDKPIPQAWQWVLPNEFAKPQRWHL
jgi:hypothetical protein